MRSNRYRKKRHIRKVRVEKERDGKDVGGKRKKKRNVSRKWRAPKKDGTKSDERRRRYVIVLNVGKRKIRK